MDTKKSSLLIRKPKLHETSCQTTIRARENDTPNMSQMNHGYATEFDSLDDPSISIGTDVV